MDWSPPTASSAYGIDFSGGPTSSTVTELGSMSTPSIAGARQSSPLHPDNPLVVFGVVAAITFGLMAFSTSVRVGGTTASLAIGDTK